MNLVNFGMYSTDQHSNDVHTSKNLSICASATKFSLHIEPTIQPEFRLTNIDREKHSFRKHNTLDRESHVIIRAVGAD